MITREDIEREYKHGDLAGVDALEDLQRIGYGMWAAIDWIAEWNGDIARAEEKREQQTKEAGQLNDG